MELIDNSSDFPTIALCSTIHNRLEFAEKTVPENLESIKRCEGVFLVLLDYNSPDGFGQWVYNNCSKAIDSGKLIYFRESTHAKFNYSHAKNLVHKCAPSDIVCNLDIDNYATDGFVEWLRTTLTGPKLFAKARRGPGGIQGRIAHWKEDFVYLGGYDESMGFGGHTMGDISLIKRSLELGFGMFQIPRKFEKVIDHPRREDYKERMEKNRKSLLNSIEAGHLRVNKDSLWGAGKVIKNFDNEIVIS